MSPSRRLQNPSGTQLGSRCQTHRSHSSLGSGAPGAGNDWLSNLANPDARARGVIGSCMPSSRPRRMTWCVPCTKRPCLSYCMSQTTASNGLAEVKTACTYSAHSRTMHFKSWMATKVSVRKISYSALRDSHSVVLRFGRISQQKIVERALRTRHSTMEPAR